MPVLRMGTVQTSQGTLPQQRLEPPRGSSTPPEKCVYIRTCLGQQEACLKEIMDNYGQETYSRSHSYHVVSFKSTNTVLLPLEQV